MGGGLSGGVGGGLGLFWGGGVIFGGGSQEVLGPKRPTGKCLTWDGH